MPGHEERGIAQEMGGVSGLNEPVGDAEAHTPGGGASGDQVVPDIGDNRFGNKGVCQPHKVTLKISSHADLVAVVPYLLGFVVEESVVVCHVVDNALDMVARLDIADLSRWQEHRKFFSRIGSSTNVSEVVLIVYTADFDAIVNDLRAVVADVNPEMGVFVYDGTTLNRISRDLWGKLDQDLNNCTGGGEIGVLDRYATAIEWDAQSSLGSAQAVWAGLYKKPSRDDVVAELSGERWAMDSVAIDQIILASEAVDHLTTAELVDLVDELTSRELANPGTLTREEIYRLVVATHNSDVLGHCLCQLGVAESLHRAWMWSRALSLTPPDWSEPVLGLAGLSSWIAGTGATFSICASIMADRFPQSWLTELVTAIQAQATPPSAWSRMRAEHLKESLGLWDSA